MHLSIHYYTRETTCLQSRVTLEPLYTRGHYVERQKCSFHCTARRHAYMIKGHTSIEGHCTARPSADTIGKVHEASHAVVGIKRNTVVTAQQGDIHVLIYEPEQAPPRAIQQLRCHIKLSYNRHSVYSIRLFFNEISNFHFNFHLLTCQTCMYSVPASTPSSAFARLLCSPVY